MTRKPNECRTCKWWESYSWACCNGDSPDCADFTQPEHSCKAWEKKDGERDSSDVSGITPRE